MEKKHRKQVWAFLRAVSALALFAIFSCSSPVEAQVVFGKRSAYKIFLEGADNYGKRDYEKAKVCFDEVKSRIDELQSVHRQDLEKWIEFNNLALAQRNKVQAELWKKQFEALARVMKSAFNELLIEAKKYWAR